MGPLLLKSALWLGMTVEGRSRRPWAAGESALESIQIMFSRTKRERSYPSGRKWKPVQWIVSEDQAEVVGLHFFVAEPAAASGPKMISGNSW